MATSSWVLSIVLAWQGPVAPPTPLSYSDMAAPTAPSPALPAPMLVPTLPAGEAPPLVPGVFAEARRPFESDHEFDGFVGPLSNPIQTKDPRSLTEARLLFLNNWGHRGTPVLGTGSFQVYALQLRVALTERLQLFADKDGIVRLSPQDGRSVTGLANIAAGFKYALIRDVENQFLATAVVQYEAPTGYANIYQNQGSGNLAAYLVLGKEFWDDWHALVQFGQNTRLHKSTGGYFLTSAHIDRRFGKFVPFYEANWIYYNQSGTFLPASVGIEGGGLLMLGTAGVIGESLVTNAVGFKYNFNPHAELGVAYEFKISDPSMLLNDMLLAEFILRY